NPFQNFKIMNQKATCAICGKHLSKSKPFRQQNLQKSSGNEFWYLQGSLGRQKFLKATRNPGRLITNSRQRSIMTLTSRLKSELLPFTTAFFNVDGSMLKDAKQDIGFVKNLFCKPVPINLPAASDHT
ncbi:hypothetical protein Ciccas_008970, partial [Cichlidogyrus casuarinus]